MQTPDLGKLLRIIHQNTMQTPGLPPYKLQFDTCAKIIYPKYKKKNFYTHIYIIVGENICVPTYKGSIFQLLVSSINISMTWLVSIDDEPTSSFCSLLA